jgi:outer membrane biosynthesis protein TonB
MTTAYQQIENKSRLCGSVGSVLICALVLLLLIFNFLPKIDITVPEGILVSFGDSFDGGGTGGDYGGSAGGGLDEGGYATPQQVASQPTQTQAAQPVASGQNAVATSDVDDAAAFVAQQQAAEQAAARRIEEDKQKAIQAAEAAQIAAENKKKQDAIDKAAKMGGALAGSAQSAKGNGTGFGTGTGTGSASGNGSGNGNGTGTGVGDGSGSGRQGNPAGRGNPNGSWSLTGREIVGDLVKPIYSKNVEGKVTIIIRVDASGSVYDVSVGTPTTISDTDIRLAAMSAAKKTRFNSVSGSGTAQGSITYNLKLK